MQSNVEYIKIDLLKLILFNLIYAILNFILYVFYIMCMLLQNCYFMILIMLKQSQ